MKRPAHSHSKPVPVNQAKSYSTNTAAQRERLLAHLRVNGSITTLEARKLLDILSPHARIKDLRNLGYPIETVMVDQYTDAGVLHNVARYVLKVKK